MLYLNDTLKYAVNIFNTFMQSYVHTTNISGFQVHLHFEVNWKF